MSALDVETAPPPALPDYLLDPNAVLKDAAEWRYGKAPDYSKTRSVYQQTKRLSHEASSLPSLVENLVKNWEIEASFKPQLSDWRTVDRANYSFAINGGPPQTAEHMLEVGTYNAIIAPNEFYSPAKSDFASSHKTFKRMMPTFAWEVVEVYSGPPQVAFRWRHWGKMENDYVGFNNKGEKITATAHNGPIDIQGVTVALVDEKVRLQKVETWFDPLEMFRQIAPNGIVGKETFEGPQLDEGNRQEEHNEALQGNGEIPKARYREPETLKPVAGNVNPNVGETIEPLPQAGANHSDSFPQTNAKLDDISNNPVQLIKGQSMHSKDEAAITSSMAQKDGNPTKKIEATPDVLHEPPPPPAVISPEARRETDNFPSRRDLSSTVQTLQEQINELQKRFAKLETLEQLSSSSNLNDTNATSANPGRSAVATASASEETRRTHEEMSTMISAEECPFLMNRE